MTILRPFWRYYGGKWRAAPRYPKPDHGTIVEPFAGAAGYSLRYPDRNVILVEKYEVIAEIWKYLVGVSESEIRRIPTGIMHVDELPVWVPVPARSLIGWWLNNASASPCKRLSAGRIRLAKMGGKLEGWTDSARDRVACQISKIRHWKIIHGDYTQAPEVRATWFIDPPYNNRAGSYYVESKVDYGALGEWCESRKGQSIVCENEGATWMNFSPFATLHGFRRGSREVIWCGGRP